MCATSVPRAQLKKWPVGANQAQITLRLSEVSAVVLNGWACNVFGDLTVLKDGDRLAVTFVGATVFEAICESLEVIKVSAHCDTRALSNRADAPLHGEFLSEWLR